MLGLGAAGLAFAVSNGMIPMPGIPVAVLEMLPPELRAMLPQA